MVTCSLCGRPVERIPAWLEGVRVGFQCTNCPSRNKSIAQLTLETSTVKESGRVAELGALEEADAEED